MKIGAVGPNFPEGVGVGCVINLGKSNPLALRRKHDISGVTLHSGDAHGVTAITLGDPELRSLAKHETLPVGRPPCAAMGVRSEASQSAGGSYGQRHRPEEVIHAGLSTGGDEDLGVVRGDVPDLRAFNRVGNLKNLAAIQRDLGQRSVKVGGEKVEINSG